MKKQILYGQRQKEREIDGFASGADGRRSNWPK